MIRFINLNNGNVYNGDTIYDENTQQYTGYVHYLENLQSINIIYTPCICLITDEICPSINVKIPDNKIFKLLDTNFDIDESTNKIKIDDTIAGVDYIDINKYSKNEINLNSKEINIDNKKYYLFLIYFNVSSSTIGEYIENFIVTLNNKLYTYRIGADFYGENEILSINLSNMGVDLPLEILKAVECSNIHEDKIDYILLNRKLKELISNYWDVIANKGSYKSLENSLKWFEYGNLIQLKELWMSSDGRFCEADLNSLLTDKYKTYLKTYYKTTNLSLRAAAQKIKTENNNALYDDEYNPELENVIFTSGDEINGISLEITKFDLQLKIELMSLFFKTYFMPIHLNLINSSIDDLVFTNTIKTINGTLMTTNSWVESIYPILCNIKDGDNFYLKNVKLEVTPETKLSAKNQLSSYIYYNKNDNNNSGIPHTYENTACYMLGVDEFKYHDHDIPFTENDSKLYLALNYEGPGVMIEFEYNIRLPKNDFIKKEIISYLPDDNINNQWLTVTFYDLFTEKINMYDLIQVNKDKISIEPTWDKSDIIKIKFNILCREARQYTFKVQFESAGGAIFNKNVTFNVIDENVNYIKLYKVQPKKYPDGKEQFDVFENINNDSNKLINDLFLGILKNKLNVENLYFLTNSESIKLNNVLIVDFKSMDEFQKHPLYEYILKNYFIFIKNIENQTLIYPVKSLNSINKKDQNNKLINPNNKLVYSDDIKKITKTDINKVYANVKINSKIYVVCISKSFGFEPESEYIEKYLENIYRNDYGYFPEFHEVTPFTTHGSSLNDYIITNEILCVKPILSQGLNIDEFEWEFKNVSTNEIPIRIKNSIKEPFICNNIKKELTNGIYNITFKYSLAGDGLKNNIHSMSIKGAFIKQ